MSESHEKGDRLGMEDLLRFRCAPGVPCFNECCQDVTIFLGPYDVLRLRRALGLSSSELIDKYTDVLVSERRLIPFINLRMGAEDKRCPFVTEEGCSVYQDRPWACRMFPIDVGEKGLDFQVIIGKDKCRGLREPYERRVQDYLNDQGTPKYQVMDDLLGELVNDERFKELDVDSEQVKRMVFMALYDLDELRRFVFGSTFLQKFEIDDRRVERLRRDDEELLRLGFEWLGFGLLGKRVLKVKEEVLEAERARTAKEGEE